MPERRRPAAESARRSLLVGSLVAAWLAAAPAWAQYKVVGPDGRVTYTDRPPSAEAGAKVTPLRNLPAATGGGAGEAPAALPAALQPVVARFPVTLYTSSDCEPCNRARLLLRQRGVPHTERTVGSDADAAALQRVTGARTVPALAVGQQVLRGLLDSEWQATLDLAGYPKTSALPAGWVPPAPRPLAGTDPAGTSVASVAGGTPATGPAATPAPARPAPAPPSPTPTANPTGSPGGNIRF